MLDREAILAEGQPTGSTFPDRSWQVVDGERRTTGEFVFGHAIVEGLREDAGRELRIRIQNENLASVSGAAPDPRSSCRGRATLARPPR